MSEFMDGMKRTIMCGMLRKEHDGQRVTLMGWTAKAARFRRADLCRSARPHGTGAGRIRQFAHGARLREGGDIRSEYVLAIDGYVRPRADDAVNPKLDTGEIEVVATDLKILSEADTPPFAIEDDTNVNETVRLKYRYLDLRPPELQKKLILRNKITKAARDYLNDNGFLEIETPCSAARRRGRKGLSGALARASGLFLRIAAVPAAVQAAAHDLGL